MLAQANKAFEAFQTLKADAKTSAQANADALNNAHQLVMQTVLFVTKTNCTPQELEQLRSLTQKSQQNKQKILEQFLLQGEFAGAQRLMRVNAKQEGRLPSFSLAKYIKLALQTRNVELLEFLLSNHDVLINSFLINDLSLAVFCLNQASAKKPILESLIVLIKHGLSLFEMDPESNLPIAHVILSTPNHPLHQAFMETKELTIHNKKFYRTLINQLQEIKLTVPEYQAEILARAIVNYSSTAEHLNSNSRIEKRQLAELTDLKEQISQHYNHEERLMLRFDREIQEKMASYTKAEQAYLNCLSRIEKLQLNKRATHVLSQVDELLTNRAPISKEELRAMVVKHLDEQIELCHALTELNGIQITLKTTPTIIGKRNAKLRGLISREAILVQRINELSVLKRIEADQKAGILAGSTVQREQSKCYDKMDDAYEPINSVRAGLSIFKPPISELPVREATPGLALQKAGGAGAEPRVSSLS